MKITVDVDTSRLAAWVNEATRSKIEQAKATALNRAAEQGRTEMARQIAREYAVPSAYVRARLFISRAVSKGGRISMEATLTGKGKRGANLIAFTEKKVTLAQHRKRAKAGDTELRFKIKRSGGVKIITGAFIGNKGRTVFIRQGQSRLPIKALSTIDVPQMFNSRKINAAVVEKIKAALPAIMQRELKWRLGLK